MTLLLIVAAWVILRRLRRIRWEPYRPEDYAPATTDPEPDPDQPPDYAAAAEIERLEALRSEYMTLLDCIEREQADLRAEYSEASTKRRAAISAKQTALAGRHAATTRTISGIDAKISKLWDAVHR